MHRFDDRLIMVYNADGGLLNALKDMAHKLLAPASYPCSLCALTYGSFTMRAAWAAFLGSLPQEKTFHHRDDFARANPVVAIALPAIVLAEGNAPPRLLVSAAELDALPDLESLIALVAERLAAPLTPPRAA